MIILLSSCTNDTKPEGLLSEKELDHLVFVGGSFIASMEQYPVLETTLTRHFYGKDIQFRNIGWPGDDIFGMARSQFGSAQNSRFWRPPSTDKGFASSLLRNHIKEAAPTTLFIGYGNEAVAFREDDEFMLFESGYERLLDFADSIDTKVVLLGPTPYLPSESSANQSLERINNFIHNTARERDLVFVDLYNEMLRNGQTDTLTYKYHQLDETGHEMVRDLILEALSIYPSSSFTVDIDENGKVLSCEKCTVTSWKPTVRGASFKLTPQQGIDKGNVQSLQDIIVTINGEVQRDGMVLQEDALRNERLIKAVKKKNRFYRNRLRPLNEAYIYLFRRHEMGHLAYEMDDLLKLVKEQEELINSMLVPYTYDIEIELSKPYKAPKSYADDEIPAFIPTPDVESELAAFQVADGYEVSLFASDPMIANPININWDNRGRAWVATSSTYPHIIPGREPNDKIVILEDTDGDGNADHHIVFAENLLVPHSVMPVKGGAYVTSTTQLLFLADTDGDDVADYREVIYDGFGNADVHHTIHGLRWMPWGDLHFTQGIYINSYINTKDGVKVLNGSGTWSYRPSQDQLSVYSRGMINPWGEAVDKWGQTFATDGAGDSGIHFTFPESAYRSAVGARNVLKGLNTETPKYTAADMVYNRHFPAEWQGNVITNDFRANRTVRYSLKPKQSAYESTEEEVLLFSEHRSYRPVDSKFGPDGALYIVDWYNPIIDHGEVDFYHPKRDKSHGRIWKVTRKGTDLLPVIDMREKGYIELLELLKSDQQLLRLQANRSLVDREVEPSIIKEWWKKQGSIANYPTLRIEVLWLLAAVNHFDQELLNSALVSKNYRERAAAIRLISIFGKEEQMMGRLKAGVTDPHPQVRLESIHALRNLGTSQAVEIAMMVMNQPMDDYLDFALDLLLERTDEAWLAMYDEQEVIFDNNDLKKMTALLNSEDPRVIPHLSLILESKNISDELLKEGWRHLARVGNQSSSGRVLERALEKQDSELLRNLNNAENVASNRPENVQILGQLLASDSADVREGAIRLIKNWKVEELSEELVTLLNSEEVEEVLREGFRTLYEIGNKDLVIEMAKKSSKELHQVMAMSAWIRKEAKEANDYALVILKNLDEANWSEHLFQTYIRLSDGPAQLTNILKGETIPEAVASVGLRVVQNSGLNLIALEESLRTSGSIESIGMAMTEDEKEDLIKNATDFGDVDRGRRVYRKSELMCGSCHVVDKEGGLSGPYLGKIGTFMTPRAILQSVINPNAVIKQNYETLVITTQDGEIVSGILHRKKENSTVVRKATGELHEIANNEIKQTDVSANSLMPTGLTRDLHRDELRDLLAYLMSLGIDD